MLDADHHDTVSAQPPRMADTRRAEADGEAEPDPRFTFANERTFLAWARTGLALIGGGLLAAHVLRFELGSALAVAVPAIALGGLVTVAGYGRWKANERALRLREPLDDAALVRMLAAGIALLAVISTAVVVVSALVK